MQASQGAPSNNESQVDAQVNIFDSLLNSKKEESAQKEPTVSRTKNQ